MSDTILNKKFECFDLEIENKNEFTNLIKSQLWK